MVLPFLLLSFFIGFPSLLHSPSLSPPPPPSTQATPACGLNPFSLVQSIDIVTGFEFVPGSLRVSAGLPRVLSLSRSFFFSSFYHLRYPVVTTSPYLLRLRPRFDKHIRYCANLVEPLRKPVRRDGIRSRACVDRWEEWTSR